MKRYSLLIVLLAIIAATSYMLGRASNDPRIKAQVDAANRAYVVIAPPRDATAPAVATGVDTIVNTGTISEAHAVFPQRSDDPVEIHSAASVPVGIRYAENLQKLNLVEVLLRSDGILHIVAFPKECWYVKCDWDKAVTLDAAYPVTDLR